MSVKLLLAEAIDTLRRGEEQEAAADHLQTATAKGQTKGRDFGRVKRDYSAAYDTYLRGLEMMNYCRRQGIDGKLVELQQFCTQKMTVYMARCEAVRDKEGNILMAVEQADASSCLDKGGYAIGDVLFTRREEFKKSHPIKFEADLSDGAYQVIVKNYDKPGVGAAEMWAGVNLDASRGKPVRVKKHVGPSCAWSRYIGVVNSGKLTVVVSTDAWLRASRVEVIVRALIPTETEDSQAVLAMDTDPDPAALQQLPQGNWVNQLPQLPSVPSGPMPGQPFAQHQQQQQFQQQPPPGVMPYGYPPQQQQGGYPGYPPPPPQQQQGAYPGYPPAGGPGYALPTNDGSPVEPMGGYGAPQPAQHYPAQQPQQPPQQQYPAQQPEQPPQQQQHQQPAASPTAPAPSAPRELPPTQKDSAPLPPPQAAAPAPAAPAPAPAAHAAAAGPYVHTPLDIPEDDDDATVGERVARLMQLAAERLPRRPTAVPQDLSAAEQQLLRDVASLPDPTPLMEGDTDDMDFGDVNLTDFD